MEEEELRSLLPPPPPSRAKYSCINWLGEGKSFARFPSPNQFMYEYFSDLVGGPVHRTMVLQRIPPRARCPGRRLPCGLDKCGAPVESRGRARLSCRRAIARPRGLFSCWARERIRACHGKRSYCLAPPADRSRRGRPGEADPLFGW